MVAALAGGVAEQYVVSGGVRHWTGSGSDWPHWLIWKPLRVQLVFAVTGGLYAAAGLLLGWLIHNRFGRKPLHSRVLRAVPLLIGYIFLPLVFAVPGIEALMTRIGLAIGCSRYLVVDFLVLVGLAVAIVALLAVEWRRFNGRAARS
jgi:hypothetical protein